MKVHNDLKELLSKFSKNHPGIEYFSKVENESYINDFLLDNSLASSEPKPLANNKQTERVCNHSFNTDGTIGYRCVYCGIHPADVVTNSKDASSR